MSALSRREFLSTASAAAVLVAMPSALAVPAAQSIAAASTPAWVVGTPDEYDWQHIIADTAEEAFRVWHEENGYYDDGDDVPEFDAEYVTRVPTWDGRKSVSSADWLRAGLGHICDRCGYETCPDMGGKAVGEEVVCEECLTFPDRLASDRDEALEELTNRIADEGEEDAREWLIRERAWEAVKDDLWPLAVAEAA